LRRFESTFGTFCSIIDEFSLIKGAVGEDIRSLTVSLPYLEVPDIERAVLFVKSAYSMGDILHKSSFTSEISPS